MTPEIKTSIDAFTSELEKRIQEYSGNKVTENIDNANSNINEINSTLLKYDIASEKDIRADEVSKITLDDIKKILSLIGQNEDSIEYLMTKIDEHYEKICNLINKYKNDYISIKNNQLNYKNEKISLYKKYIDLFDKEKVLDEPFDELNELLKVLSEVGLPNTDIWKIMSYIGKANISTIDCVDPKLFIRIMSSLAEIMTYLENEELLVLLESKLSTSEVHIDTIPVIAADFSHESGLDEDISTNMIATLIANALLAKLNKTKNKIIQIELIEIINSILNLVQKLDDPDVRLAKDIRKQTYEFYYNSVTNGTTEEMIKEYMETPITNLTENENISREHAIELKQLSVLKPIYDTLDTIDLLDKETEEYKKALIVLNKLIEQYYILENKKEGFGTKNI